MTTRRNSYEPYPRPAPVVIPEKWEQPTFSSAPAPVAVAASSVQATDARPAAHAIAWEIVDRLIKKSASSRTTKRDTES